MKIPPFHDHLVVEDIYLSCLSTLLQCTRVQRFHKRCFYLFYFILLLFFLMKVNLCLKLADGSYEYHKCAIMSQTLAYIFCWMLLLAKKWNLCTTKHLSDQNERCKWWNCYILLCLKVGMTWVEGGVDQPRSLHKMLCI